MAPHELRGETLGEKHRDYNKLLQEQITSHSTLPDDKTDDSDINHLLKIDIASHKKDVKFILDVLKCDDMLYVSRALSRSAWLITDQEYANVINPDYLQTEMFPNMTTKAITKFKKYIRHNIKDETRAEQFYLNEKNKCDAVKWLPHCSVQFIENNIENYFTSPGDSPMKLRLFKRLCEKSIKILDITLKHFDFESRKYIQAVSFLLNTDIDTYLDVLEKTHMYRGPKLNHKATELIMKHSPNRISEKMELYVSIIHLPTYATLFKADEIKAFLIAQAKKDIDKAEYSNLRNLFKCDTLKHFIRRLPVNEQFDFVKTVCMPDIGEQEDLLRDTDVSQVKKMCEMCNKGHYDWYQFAPFEYAFEEITKLISQSTDSQKNFTMLSFLIKCANRNLQHIQLVLKYYTEKHRSEHTASKLEFVTDTMNRIPVTKCHEKMWDILNEVLTSMNIYDGTTELSSDNKEIVNFIIIYNVLNNRKIPEIIDKLFIFDTFKSYKTNLKQDQQNKIVSFLYKRLITKINNPVSNKTEFTEMIKTLENIFTLLRDWDKPLQDYPLLLNKIRQLIQLKKENSWKESLSSLYNINKSWRKYMFEESVALCPNEEVCLNALKHEPQLLSRHSDEVNALRTDDDVSLLRVISKLRVYWPQTLGQQWTSVYLNNINEASGQQAAVQGMCALLPQKPLRDIIEKYKPEKAYIDWKQTDERVLNIQRFFAKNMHLSRPQPSPDTILSYAKGDYLQYALPSLLAIFYNLKSSISRQYIPKLLDAPVSVQKHGIRHAFKTLNHEELKIIFLNCWKTSKNASIRAIIFKFTYTLLCDEKDSASITGLWELLELFIDNLTFTENKDIYNILIGSVDKVPLTVRAKYLVKVYTFIKKLIPNMQESDRSYFEMRNRQLAEHSRVVMDVIDPDFVTSIIQEYVDNEFFKVSGDQVSNFQHADGMIQVLTAYLLCSKNEEDQIHKYDTIFVPLMRRSFEKWGQKHNGLYIIRQHVGQLLVRLSYDLKEYVIENKMMTPLKMFTNIQVELEKSLAISENYVLLTKWKLTVALTKLVQEYSSLDNENISLAFGKICLDFLKNDVAVHFPCIYVLFFKSLKELLYHMIPQNARSEFYNAMLSDKDFIQSYLCAIEIGSQSYRDEEYVHMKEQILSHPSVEVKMHYYSKISTM